MKLAVFTIEGQPIAFMGGPEQHQALTAYRIYNDTSRYVLRDVEGTRYNHLFDLPNLSSTDAELRSLGIEPGPPDYTAIWQFMIAQALAYGA